MEDQHFFSVQIADDIPIIIDNCSDINCDFNEEEIVIPQKYKKICFSTKFYNFNDVSDWGKSLENMPVFTIREIENHRQLSGKIKSLPIAKTLQKGRKFKYEGFVSSDTIFTAYFDKNFWVKCKCKASMKNEFRNVNIVLDSNTSRVLKAYCSCPAGKSGYCNHVMALLLLLADYSLQDLKSVPEEVSCTSQSRVWGVPGVANFKYKSSVMESVIHRSDKKGIQCTLYDPRLNFDDKLFEHKVNDMKSALITEDKKIGFASCISYENVNYTSTKYGQFPVGSPLSFHLQPVEPCFEILTNISKLYIAVPVNKLFSFDDLPLQFIKNDVFISKEFFNFKNN